MSDPVFGQEPMKIIDTRSWMIIKANNDVSLASPGARAFKPVLEHSFQNAPKLLLKH